MITVALQQDVEIILPGSAELVWGGLTFVLVSAALLAMVFFVVRAATRRSGRAEVDHWRERAIRAEAERDLLSHQHEDT